MNKMAQKVDDPWFGDYGFYADVVETSTLPTHSKLLGPDGQPLQYEPPKVGFDLSRRNPKE